MSDDPTPGRAERLTNALVEASITDEYKDALTSEDGYLPWRKLAEIAIRDGRKTLAFVDEIPNERIPGFREANLELAQRFGVRFVMVVDNRTHKVTRCYVEPAKIVDGVIYASDDASAPG